MMKSLEDFVNYFIVNLIDVSSILTDCNCNIEQIKKGKVEYRVNKLVEGIYGDVS